MHPLIRALRRNTAVRAVGLPLYRANARLHSGVPPRVLANSLPKSGTHLVTALLDRLPAMRYSGHHLTAYDFARDGKVDWAALGRRLASVSEGQYVSAHLPASPVLFDIVTRLGYRCLFAIRDPRDAAVSDMHYIARFPKHPLHSAMNALPVEQRLAAVVTGMPGERRGIPLLESMPQRLDDYLGWTTAPATRTVRFEALVGSRGGGDDDLQVAEIMAIGSHVGRPLDERQAKEVAASIWSSESSTFRQGTIGDWRRHFTEADKQLVKRLAGDRLVAIGYEHDDGW
jgi:sulfotransferase 6B1